MAEFIRIRNWEKFQHYKERTAPWIKLYRDMMESSLWVMGSDASKLLATCTMLLAVRNDNKIPLDPAYIRRVCHLEHEPDFTELVKHQFVEIIDENGECYQNASKMLASCTREREREKRREDTTASKKPEASADFEHAWTKFPKRAGSNPKSRALKAWNARIKEGATATDITAGIERYAAFIRLTGKAGTEYVMQTSTFLGPDKHFMEAWERPKDAKKEDWWSSDKATQEKASEIGLIPRSGESWNDFKGRIKEKLLEH